MFNAFTAELICLMYNDALNKKKNDVYSGFI